MTTAPTPKPPCIPLPVRAEDRERVDEKYSWRDGYSDLEHAFGADWGSDELGWGELDSLRYCKSLGYDWGGLYDVFVRVSCFCCPKGGKTKRRLIQQHYPELWKEWQRLDGIAAGRDREEGE